MCAGCGAPDLSRCSVTTMPPAVSLSVAVPVSPDPPWAFKGTETGDSPAETATAAAALRPSEVQSAAMVVAIRIGLLGDGRERSRLSSAAELFTTIPGGREKIMSASREY